MIGSLLCYVCAPLSRFLTVRFAVVSKKLSPPAEVNGSAGWDGAAVTPGTFTQSQMALLDRSVSPTRGSEGETGEPNQEKQDSTRLGMEEKPPVTSSNEDEDTVSGPMSEGETGKPPEHQDEEINILHEVLKVTDGGNMSSLEVISPEEALQKPEDTVQANTSPAQKEIQTSGAAATPTGNTSTQTQIPVTETSAAEAECWDEHVFPYTVETSKDINYLKVALSSTESGRPAQTGCSSPAGLGQAEEALCPPWEFHPSFETAAPAEVIWREWKNLEEDAAAAQPTPMPPPLGKASVDFTVMSYNILAQHLLEVHGDLYAHCAPEVLDWSYRFNLLLEEIQKWLPDILCLQEVQENHYLEQLEPVLYHMGYTCVFKRRTGYNSDGCATCYRASRFVDASVTQLEFFRPETGLLDRHNVGVVLLLRPLVAQGSGLTESGPALCVANTHLVFNPGRGDVKLAQLAIVLAEIHRVTRSCKSSGEHCNVLLCGDFNSVPHMPLYQLVTTGLLFYKGLPSWMVSGQEDLSHRLYCHRLAVPLWPSSLGISNRCQMGLERPEQKSGEFQYDHDFMLSLRFCPTACVRPEGLELIPGVTDGTPDPPSESQSYKERFGPTISHQLDLESVYKFSPGGPDVSTLHSGTGAVVDYIFYSPKRAKDHGGLKLTGFLPLLSEDVLWSMNGIPNQLFPSDHLSLLAKFQLDVNTA